MHHNVQRVLKVSEGKWIELRVVPRITFGNDVKIALLKKYKKEKSL